MYSNKRKKVRFINRWSRYIKKHTLYEGKTSTVMTKKACMMALTLGLIFEMKRNQFIKLSPIPEDVWDFEWEVITK